MNFFSVLAPRLGDFVTPRLIKRIKEDTTIIALFKDCGVDLTKKPDNSFDGIYACTLFHCYYDREQADGVDGKNLDEHAANYLDEKKYALMKLFTRQEIKEAFQTAFKNNDYDIVSSKIKNIIDDYNGWNDLGEELRKSGINISQELEDFQKKFNDFIDLSQNPSERRDTQKLDEVLATVNSISSKLNPSESTKPNLKPYPDEFKTIIEEKVKSFCGRKFVFSAFQEFCKNNVNGYFIVIGDAGMGKSTIAAKYVSDRHFPCYFNVISEGRNRPEQFLTNIRQQLITRYNLVDQDAQDADLSGLLVKVSQKLPKDESLVIVVDALDEVEQEPGAGNILFLPETLPQRVYFFLTRRPYTPKKKRLRISVPSQELDLKKVEYETLNAKDIKGYIRLFLNHDDQHKDNLRKWIAERDISADNFIEQVAAKSDNNFMYLRYVLPAIANGFYNDLSLQQLPSGLQDYYRIHWVRMGMDDKPQDLRVIILFILIEIATAIPCEMIAEIANQDEYNVQSFLDEWVEYLKKQVIEGETCYSIYHASFLDFLKDKRELKRNRKIFQEVNQRIADYLGVEGDNIA